MSKDRKLPIAVVGTGAWWGYHHARIYHARPDAELVGILGRRQEKAESRAAEFGTTAYTDVGRLLEEGQPDLVEVNGRDGRLLVEDTVRRYTFDRAGDETAQVWQAGYFNDREREFHRTFDRHADAFLAAFRAGDPPPLHASAGRRALSLAWAIVESFESGSRVRTTL